MHRGLPPKLPHQLPGEISTGHTDVDTLPPMERSSPQGPTLWGPSAENARRAR